MKLNRRDFIKNGALLTAASGVNLPDFFFEGEVLAGVGDLPVVWLQAQGCSGCSVSFLNSVHYATADDLLLNALDVRYHPTMMAAADRTAKSAAMDAYSKGGYLLIVEGAIPTAASGRYCHLWSGVTALDGITSFAKNAEYIIALGTCAAFGGMAAGAPNSTASVGVADLLARARISTSNLINIPGCPAHPDWLVGTISSIIQNGRPPALDINNRPTAYYGVKVHDKCKKLGQYKNGFGRFSDHSGGEGCLTCHSAGDGDLRRYGAMTLGQRGCLYALGCRGPSTGADCPTRKWNGATAQSSGVNYCIDAGSPCHGCTEPNFPDGMSPFFTLGNNGKGIEA